MFIVSVYNTWQLYVLTTFKENNGVQEICNKIFMKLKRCISVHVTDNTRWNSNELSYNEYRTTFGLDSEKSMYSLLNTNVSYNIHTVVQQLNCKTYIYFVHKKTNVSDFFAFVKDFQQKYLFLLLLRHFTYVRFSIFRLNDKFCEAN